jgi:flavin-dependent dehydrogenase
MIRRVEFDNLLVSLAVEAGATLVTGADVAQVTTMRDGVALVSRDGRCFEAPVVVAADGVHSVVARRLGINPGWKAGAVALDMMEETPRTRLRDVDPSTLWVAYGFTPPGNGGTGNGETGSRETGGRGTGNSGPAAEGYAYVFPKRDHVNVGIGYVLSHYRSHLNISPHALQRTIVTHLRGRGLLEGESVRENFTPFVIPIGGPLEHVASGRVLVAGDAGGFVNGVTAEGIYYAMVTGELAARAIVDAGANVPTLAPRYQKACNREIGRELRDSVLLQRYLFADRRRIARVVNGARRNAKLTALLLDFVQGRLSYHQLRWRLLTRSPVFAAEWLRAWKWV